MDEVEWKDPVTGRYYKALQSGDQRILLGPPQELTDWLNLPEPFATNLHNALYRRGVWTFREASRNNVLLGALQEALSLDVQRLHEAYYALQNQEVSP